MKWKWCEMCQFDRHCENQDRNRECACYAREQTLRAEQYANLIDKQQKQLEIAVEALDSLRGICFPQRAEKALEQIKELEK